jgi:diguanylate cyclase (GGDEF)-like protein
MYLLLVLVGCNQHHESETSLLFLGNNKLAPILYEERGKPKGLVIDIINEVEKRIETPISVQLLDWNEAQNLMYHEKADALLQINPTPEREKIYDFTVELLRSDFSLFTSQGAVDIRNREALAGKRIGVEPGGYPHQLLLQDTTMTLYMISDWESGFSALRSGEIDILIVDRWIGEYELAQSGIKNIVVASYQLDSLTSHIAVHKGNHELLAKLNQALVSMKEDGSMNTILSHYRGKQVVYLTHDYIRDAALLGFGLVMALLLVISMFFVQKFRKLNKQLENKVKERTVALNIANNDLKEVNRRLKHLSELDGLTNLANRRYFDETLKNVWDICAHEKQPVSILMLDIDNFKRFNDTYGHMSGDDCLRTMAKLLMEAIDETKNLVGRYGGEEFVVLMENTDLKTAKKLAENIRASVEFLHNQNPPFPTISIGVSTGYPHMGMLAGDLISSADAALYRAKASGRNRISW